MQNTIFISIGSNVGDRMEHSKKAVGLLEAFEGGRISVAAISSFYRTEPVGYTDQDWFVNCVVKLETPMDLTSFFKATRKIEALFSRRSDIKWGPREIDIDILFFNDVIINEEGLIIPHPLCHQRRFVLIPMCEIEPTFIHPVLKKSIKGLLDGLDTAFQRVEIV